MSKHKTRQQRRNVKVKPVGSTLVVNNSQSLSWTAEAANNKKPVSPKRSVETVEKTQSLDKFFNYDTQLITKDLIRTVVSSVVVFGVLVALYYQL